MLFSALCIDNTNYFRKGTIRVRIFSYYNAPSIVNGEKVVRDDLSKNFDLKDEGNIPNTDIHEEFEAIVFAPFGGGRNYGAFHLPQMNEKGVVAFLDGDFGKPIWLGSYFAPRRDGDNFDVTSVNIPNEDPAKNEDGIVDQEYNSSVEDKIKGDKDTIVIRQKTTSNDSAENLDWEEITTENLVVMDDKKVRVRHSSEYDNGAEKKYQEVIIYPDSENDDKETIKLEVSNEKDNKKGVLKLTDDGFKIELYEDGSITNSFELTSDDNESAINFVDEHGNSIVGDDEGLHLSSDSSTIIDINGTSDTIVLYSNLKDILEKLAEHIHISSVPTTPPLDSSLAPISPQLTKPIIDMEGNRVKSEHQ
jgi:hypothetical protein